jgi:hypothetical protein
MILILGSCNKCGSCCVVDIDGEMCKCEHLIINPGKRISEPEATECGIYDTRYDGIPMRVVNSRGRVMFKTVCHKECVRESVEINARGIGKGCSLTIYQIAEKK